MQYDKIWSYIEAGKQAGAKVALGGQKRSTKGYYVDPTSKLDAQARTRAKLTDTPNRCNQSSPRSPLT